MKINETSQLAQLVEKKLNMSNFFQSVLLAAFSIADMMTRGEFNSGLQTRQQAACTLALCHRDFNSLHAHSPASKKAKKQLVN